MRLMSRLLVRIPEEPRLTSMCMQIASFTCGDCPAPPWCTCKCHGPLPA